MPEPRHGADHTTASNDEVVPDESATADDLREEAEQADRLERQGADRKAGEPIGTTRTGPDDESDDEVTPQGRRRERDH